MKEIKNLYLVRLFRQNKCLFVLVIFFIFFQQYFYLKDNSTFPWYVWSMYSYPSYAPQKIKQTEISVNGKPLNTAKIPIWQEAVVLHTFSKYYELEQNKFIDPINNIIDKRHNAFPFVTVDYMKRQIANQTDEAKKYPSWIRQYVENEIINEEVNTIEFKEIEYQYKNFKFSKTDSVKLLFKIKN